MGEIYTIAKLFEDYIIEVYTKTRIPSQVLKTRCCSRFIIGGNNALMQPIPIKDLIFIIYLETGEN